MKKRIIVGLLIVLMISLTGCGHSEDVIIDDKSIINNNDVDEKKVIKDQIFEGLEFVNVSVNNGIIKTIVINNTGFVYEGSKIKMKIMDANGEILFEGIDEVKGPMGTGTTKEIETITNVDLSTAASIEYKIVNE